MQEYKNIKRRLHKTTASMWYNKNCKKNDENQNISQSKSAVTTSKASTL